MNVRALILPTNIAENLICVGIRLRFDDGSKDSLTLEVPLITGGLKPQIATHLQREMLQRGHVLTQVVFADCSVAVL